MGLSASSLNPISAIEYRTTIPQAYRVENRSEVSDSFVEAMRGAEYANRVDAAAPVQYATANVTTSRIEMLQKSQEANKAYNDLAASFGGVNISYGTGRQAESYAVIGSQFDAFA